MPVGVNWATPAARRRVIGGRLGGSLEAPVGGTKSRSAILHRNVARALRDCRGAVTGRASSAPAALGETRARRHTCGAGCPQASVVCCHEGPGREDRSVSALKQTSSRWATCCAGTWLVRSLLCGSRCRAHRWTGFVPRWCEAGQPDRSCAWRISSSRPHGWGDTKPSCDGHTSSHTSPTPPRWGDDAVSQTASGRARSHAASVPARHRISPSCSP